MTLKIKEIYKNAAIFTFLCLVRNVLLTVILVVWIALAGFFAMTAIYSQNGFVYGFFFAFIMTLFFGFIFYTVAFFTYPPIKKYVLDPYYE